MKIAKLILCLAWLTSGSLLAQEAKVTPLISRDLLDIPGKEGLMITVNTRQVLLTPYTATMQSPHAINDPRMKLCCLVPSAP